MTFSIVSGPATVSGSNDSTITYNAVGTVVIATSQSYAGGSYPQTLTGDADRYSRKPVSMHQ